MVVSDSPTYARLFVFKCSGFFLCACSICLVVTADYYRYNNVPGLFIYLFFLTADWSNTHTSSIVHPAHGGAPGLPAVTP